MVGDLTLRDLLNRADQDETHLIKLRLSAAESHEELLKQVEAGIEWALQEMTSTRQHRQNRGEDELTVELVSLLRAIGIKADHDTAIGGHADIVVRQKLSFMWLGECKLWKGKSWLFKGFRQLATRYATGLPGQDNGGVISYFYNGDVALLMSKYKKALSDRKKLDIELHDERPLSFRTKNKHQGSGMPYHVKHSALVLHFNPDDA